MGTVDFSIQRRVLHEAGHTLNFCMDKTKMKLRSFRGRSLAEFLPMFSNGIRIEFGDLAESQLKGPDAFGIRLTRLQKRFCKNRLGCSKFTHLGILI